MKSVCFSLTHPAGSLANEIIDIISVAAVFDLPVGVMFLDDGVWQLFDATTSSEGKNTTNYLSALPTYGVSEFLVSRECLESRHLDDRFKLRQVEEPNPLFQHLTLTDSNTIGRRMRDFDLIISD